MNLKDLFEKHQFHVNGILHVGAGWLEEAQLYSDMGVKKVIWVEALPATHKRRERAEQFGHELIEAIPFSDRTELVTLRVASNSVSSSILPFKRHSEIYPDIVVEEEIKALSLRADQVFQDHFPKEIDTLVLDVQGAELKVLRGMGKLLNQIQRIFTETNLTEMYEGCVLEPQLRDWLAKRGFVNWETFDVHLEEWREAFAWR